MTQLQKARLEILENNISKYFPSGEDSMRDMREANPIQVYFQMERMKQFRYFGSQFMRPYFTNR